MFDLVSILDVKKRDLEDIFSLSDKFSSGKSAKISGKTVAGAFFEPSTRTALSFETAAKKLGMQYIGFRSTEGLSIEKGESFADTIRMLDAYADCIIVRHRFDGAAKFASEIAEKPVINAGDGKNEHPTQAIIDLYTMRKTFGGINGLTIGIMGDAKYARTINSLLLGLNLFDIEKAVFIVPEGIKPKEEITRQLNYKYQILSNAYEVIGKLDVLYVTRIQKERYADPLELKRMEEAYKVTTQLSERMKENAVILHPLPRVNEIDKEVDYTKHAKYFQQAAYGVPVRMAILYKILGG